MASFGTLYTYTPNARVLKVAMLCSHSTHTDAYDGLDILPAFRVEGVESPPCLPVYLPTSSYPGAPAILAAAKLNGVSLSIPSDYRHGVTNKTSGFLSKFPAGKVPAFEGAGAGARGRLLLCESDAIAEYVSLGGPKAAQLLGSTAEEKAKVRQWVAFAEGEINAHVLELVMWRAGLRAYDEKTEREGDKGLRSGMGVLEEHLAGEGGRKWVVSEEELSLADLTLAGSLYWGFMQYVDEEMRCAFPNVVEWYRRVVGAEGVKEVFGPVVMCEKRRGPAQGMERVCCMDERRRAT
ncbi:hypothetical protein MKZ38_005490 [Zalerion maritima]|uniref:Glutathione S-transferase n=1 Tax=Zalerion maritima TaxID=339359 RepID=A0AAD5WUR6_9PEZI|nr:hypothetical protein MKZ38_005490 [Zalerion maritima]